jgi:hypothetical protein
MNITALIQDIMSSEQLYNIALPFKAPIEVIVQQGIEKSVRTFSEFKRQRKEDICLISSLASPSEVDKCRNIFLVPPHLTTTPVKDVYGFCETPMADASRVNMNTFTVGSPFVGFGSYYPQDILNAQMTGVVINKFAGVTTRQPTVKYLGYNKIQLFDFPKNSAIRLIVECEHDLSCETIPESCRESFLELATLDVEMELYNSLVNTNGVGSGYKENQYKIDRWSGAAEKRTALVKQWTETYHLDDTDAIMFF